MQKLPLALAAVAFLAFAAPASAGGGHHGYYYGPYYHGPYYPQYAGPPLKRRHKAPRRQVLQYEQTVQQIRKECQMFAFAYWRYHPDYRHCRNY